jgi:hypothetical protein
MIVKANDGVDVGFGRINVARSLGVGLSFPTHR